MKVCTIHQPNFFPWLGYFDKIKRCDVFVFLDNVAYPKSGSGSGSWVNRVKLNINAEARWVGCPIKRESGVQFIKEVKIDDSQPWRTKLLKSLEFNYKKQKNYSEIMGLIEPLILYDNDNLSEFNINAIKAISAYLKIETNFILQSDLDVNSAATELLVDIVKITQTDAYLCGGGADGYQQDELFSKNQIELIYQNYKPEPYGDPATFLPGLSIVDWLMKN